MGVNEEPVTTRLGETVGAYLSLVRLPNLFTAPPDVLLGAALIVAAGRNVAPIAVVGLAVASIALYAAGTTLNDYFDAPIDAEERPDRPIPSGQIARSRALALGLVLLAIGIVVAGVTAGFWSAVTATLIAVAILLYDGGLKGSAVGFLAMGVTRGLNVMLGMTASGGNSAGLPTHTLVVPFVIVSYIASVTFMATGETHGGNRTAVVIVGAGVSVAAVAAVITVGLNDPSLTALMAVILLSIVFVSWTGRALARAYTDPTPSTVGPAVGMCVLGLVVLDAAFAAVAGVGWAVVTVIFLGPAIGLARIFDVT